MFWKNWDHATHIKLASYLSVCIASVLIVLKLSAWLVTQSVSLQASLIDSVLDAAASLINMIAIRHALRPADREHRFGHGKVESIAALLQSVVIGASSLWLFYEAIHRFFIYEATECTSIGLIVMAGTIILTLFLVSYQNYVVRRTGSAAIAADMLHYRSDILINFAVVISLLSAKFFQISFIDPLFGLGIGLYILWTAWKIILDAFAVLMDSEMPEEDRKQILNIVLSHPEIQDVRDLKTRTSGLEQFFQMHILVDGHYTLLESHRVATEIEQKIMTIYPKSQIMLRLQPQSLHRKLKPKHMI